MESAIPAEGLVIPDVCAADIDALATAVVSDGRWHVLSAGGGTACCWPADAETVTATRVRRPYCYESPTDLVSLTLTTFPDGTDVVVARDDRQQLHRWDAASGEPLGDPSSDPALMDLTRRWRLAAAPTPDGAVTVTAAGREGLARWDVRTGRRLGETLGREYGSVWSLASGRLPDGTSIVVSGSRDGCLHKWDPATGGEIGPPITRCGVATALDLARLRDGRLVACVLSATGRLHRFDLLTGEPVAKTIRVGWEPGPEPWKKICLGHIAVAVTSDGATIATCPDGQRVRLWDLESGGLAGELPGVGLGRNPGIAAAILRDGTAVFAAAGPGGNVHRFDARDGTPVVPLVRPHGAAAETVRPVALRDGRILLAANGRDYAARLVDARTGAPAGERCHDVGFNPLVVPLPDGRIVAVAGANDISGISIHDLESGARYPAEPVGQVWDVAVATLPDDRVIIGGAGHGWQFHRWDAATGEAVGEPGEGHPISVKAVAVARQADGKPMFITGCEAGQLFRWDAETGERIGSPLDETEEQIRDLAVVDLASGGQALIGLDDQAIYRWDPLTGELFGSVPLGGEPYSVATHVDAKGLPVAFVGVFDDDIENARVERWRLDTLTRVDSALPRSFRAVFADGGIDWMVLAEPDGSLVVKPLPPIPG